MVYQNSVLVFYNVPVIREKKNQLNPFMSAAILNKDLILCKIQNTLILVYISILNAAAFTGMLLGSPGDPSLSYSVKAASILVGGIQQYFVNQVFGFSPQSSATRALAAVYVISIDLGH